MADSAPEPMPPSDTPRPRWRFSGRRGTPVAQRGDANAAPIAPEIQQIAARLRDNARTGDDADSATNGSVPREPSAPSHVQPPVAGEALPVERRAARADQPHSPAHRVLSRRDHDAAGTSATIPGPSSTAVACEPSALIDIPAVTTTDEASTPAPAKAASTTPIPEATGGRDAARDAAWELGRIPFLVHGVGAEVADSHTDDPPAREAPATAAQEPVAVSLDAPADAAPLRARPAAIERLTSPLYPPTLAPVEAHARVRAREVRDSERDRTPIAVRRRLQERRMDLERTLADLARTTQRTSH